MSKLYYRFEKEGRDAIVDFLRRAFTYAGPWRNEGLEIVAVDDTVGDSVFEVYFEEEERYPVITVSTTGGNHVRMAFNEQIHNFYDNDVPFGTRAYDYVAFNPSAPFVFNIPPGVVTGSISGMTANMIWSSPNTIDDINVNLYQNYFTASPVLLSSGSIQSFDSTVLQPYFCSIWPKTTIESGGDYTFELTPISGSVYKMAVDTSASGYYSTVDKSGPIPVGTLVSGSLYGGVRYSPVFRLGGAHEFNTVIRCSAKNSIEKCQNLADLVEVYLMLTKYGYLNRVSTNEAKIDLQYFTEITSYLTNRGISVIQVSKGGIENRRRGDNDIIFTMSVTANLRTEWYFDADENHILDIEVLGI